MTMQDGSLEAIGAASGDEQAATTVYARLFQALADPTRLEILQHLSLGEHRVRDLVEHLGFAQSTVSNHLHVLLEHGLVRFRSVGRASLFALAEPEALAAALLGAERLLGARGSSVRLRPSLTQPQAKPEDEDEVA